MSSPNRRTTTSPRRSGSSGANSKKSSKKYIKPNVVPAPKPLDVLFDAQDVVRSLAVPPNLAVKIAENANLLYQQNQDANNGKSSSSARKSSSNNNNDSKAQRNKAQNARSSLQDALENIDNNIVSRLQHANLVASTFANAQLSSTQETLRQYVGLFEGAKDEAAQLEAEMQERDRDAVRVVDFLRRELEDKHIQHQRLIQEHKAEMRALEEKSEHDHASLKNQLQQKDFAVDNLKKEVERLQGELDMVAEFRRERIQLQHEHARHIQAEEELTQKFEREITSLKFQNLEDRLRLRAVENEMSDKFQEEVHLQASKLVDAKGRAIREENDQLRSHTMRLHEEVEDLANIVDTKGEQLEHTQREVELSLQTQGEYARRSVIQSRTAKDAIEKVKQLQSELSTTQRETKAARMRDKQMYEGRISDLQSKLDAAHASLVAHRRDLIKTRNLAKRIVAQRSELEQFFYDALEYVNAEMKLEQQIQNGRLLLTAGSQQQQQQPPSSAPSNMNNYNMAGRRTMTNELKVLPNPVRKVVSARRDIGYRGDLDAAVVPTESFNAHSGLHAQSARRPPQGCFSSQSDFAVPRTNQFMVTKKEAATSEYAKEQTAASASPTRSMSSNARTRKENMIRGVLSEHRREYNVQDQQPENQNQPEQEDGEEVVEQRNNNNNNNIQVMYPEMHQVMFESGKVENDFRNLTWYDKEKVISAMLHHLNKATLADQQQSHAGRQGRIPHNNNDDHDDGENNDDNIDQVGGSNSNGEFPYLPSNQASVGDFYFNDVITMNNNNNQKNQKPGVNNRQDGFEQIPINNNNNNTCGNQQLRPSTSQQQQQNNKNKNNAVGNKNQNGNNRRLYDGEEDDPFPVACDSSNNNNNTDPLLHHQQQQQQQQIVDSQTSSEVNSRAQTAESRPSRVNYYFGGNNSASSRGGSAASNSNVNNINSNVNRTGVENVSWDQNSGTARKPQIPRPPISSAGSQNNNNINNNLPVISNNNRNQTPNSSNINTLQVLPTPRPATQAANNSEGGEADAEKKLVTPSTVTKKTNMK